MAQFLDRLEKRLYDLQLSRQITIQSAPQIRMIQQTNQTLAEKIQSSIMTSIPLWKNQIAIALTLNRQMKAVESQKLVTQTTNDLLLKNSEMLKINSIETAKENERGIIEIDTLKKTQENLIQTIEETLLIQADGRAKRKSAEIEIARMEEELKQRLLGIHEKHKTALYEAVLCFSQIYRRLSKLYQRVHGFIGDFRDFAKRSPRISLPFTCSE